MGAFAKATATRCQCGGMVDAIDSKSITRKGVEVRVLSLAQINNNAAVVELVDTYASGAYAARCEGSSPFARTI